MRTSRVTHYPLHLDVRGRRVLVVGGGPVAARRATTLADAGAEVVVVAPYVCEEIAGDVRLRVALREWTADDLDGVWLVQTATGEPAVDAAVAAAAEDSRIWCVRADSAEESAAWTPALLQRDDVVVSVTAGGDPGAPSVFATRWPQRWTPAACRSAVNAPVLDMSHSSEADPATRGSITTRGRALLAQADVVVVDRLAPRALLAELDEDVEVIEAGKAPHAHTLTQAQIEDVLVERARAGLRVVRLKGGDPYVLGRGGEEALACVAAGVPVEVVPGVTSAIAVPALAGIPVTHRGLARGFTVVSVHDTDVAWDALARVDGTLVLLMGVGRLAEATAGLVDAGLATDTPVAVIENGSTPQQRTTVATLASIAEEAERRAVRSPAVVVIGDVVRLADALGPPPATLVLAAHGSPDARHAATVGAVVASIRDRGRPAVVGWLGHSSPSLADAVDHAGEHAVVVPFLLAPAFHAREDVPAGASGAPVADVLVPDGAVDVRLVRALASRLAETGAGFDAVVLTAVGSRDPAHAATVSRVAVALGGRLGVPVVAAYTTATPTLGEAVAALGKPVQRVAVASLFLAPGVLHDRVVAEAGDLGLAAVSAPLGAHPDLVELLVARADAAR